MKQVQVRFLSRETPPHMATLVLLSCIAAIGMNIFLPSLPNMTRYFATEYRTMQLSVALYLASNAVLQILIGPLADKMGRRPILLWGIALFCLATLGCIFAPTAEAFLAFRMCQAIIAVSVVLSRAAVRDMYPEDKAASVLGYVTMGMAVVPMMAPALGGVMDETFGWQASFWLMLVLGIAIWGLTYFDFGETALKSGKTLVAQFREYPELLTSPRFWGYSLATSLSSGAFFAYLGGAPFVGTEVFGMNPQEMGLYFGAPAIGYFLGNYLSGRYSMRFGINRMVLWGCVLGGLGVLASLSFDLIGRSTPLSFFGLMTLVGVGNGLSIPNATAGALSVRPHLAASAAGLSGSIMLGGGAALSALAGTLLTPETGALPLLLLMLATSALSVISIAVVTLRERQLGL